MDKILIADFGSQYTQLIARRLRELNVYCEIYPYNKLPEPDQGVHGLILSGSPASVTEPSAPQIDLTPFYSRVPILGICYGAQYLAHTNGGKVMPSPSREYGRAMLRIAKSDDPLFEDVTSPTQVWMSHGDTILQLPPKAHRLASTADVENAAYRFDDAPVWAIQFHPEVYHTSEGTLILRNFVASICSCRQDWTPQNFVEQTVSNLRQQLGNDKVILGLSGGVDSSVAAILLKKAIGNNLHCIFVDSGLLRQDEYAQVLASYKNLGLNVTGVDASDRFFTDLQGVVDPEQKRKIIGRDFVETFNEAAQTIKDVKWLAQGTIYPDVVESASVNAPTAKIKSHHNVGGLPEKMQLRIVEPLRLLFKDEVRRVGRSLGMSRELIGRHPFPGPGLGIRILGEVTREKVNILQQADKIFIDNLKKTGLYDKVWQAGAILLPVQSVGVMGDERTYERCVALRAVSSVDGMTADWVHLPYDFLANTSNEIINKVKGINRVVYDISSKPPATIEWE